MRSYTSDHIFTVDESPYIVNSWVTFGSNANITIENGVKIIFIEDFFISVFGALNCGCNQAINNNIRGLSNNITYTHLFGNVSSPKSPGIFINQQFNSNNPPKIEFCNTIFEKLQNGIQSTSNQYAPYTVKNCEFRFLNYGIKHKTNIINFVYNSYFHDLNDINSDGYVIYDNCLFTEFGEFSEILLGADSVAIRNSEMHGNGANENCLNINSITGDPSIAVYNNIISDCKHGIYIRNTINVRNNTITNCLWYGIYGVNISGDVDISYNSFNNNAIYDIMVDDSENIEIINNDFISQTNHSAAIYGGYCDNIDIKSNNFVSVQYDNIMLFRDCGELNVMENEFINNNNKYGSIYSQNVENITISYNNFIGNDGEYLIKIEDGINNDIGYNNIINMTISDHLIDINDTEYIQISFNVIMGNKYKTNKSRSGELILIQNANYLDINNNPIKNNYAHNNIISSTMNDNVYIQYNIFTQNGVHKEQQNDINTNLIYCQQSIYTMIEYNRFENSIDIENVLYFSYLNKNDMVLIKNNDFISLHNKIINYIYIEDGDINDIDSVSLIEINFNNFYDFSNLNYFLSTNNININANNNYWSGLKTYEQISYNIYDICDNNKDKGMSVIGGLIDISSIMEESIINDIANDTILFQFQCFWDILNCDNITNYRCDSDTPSPTKDSLSPSLSPTNPPEISIIIPSPSISSLIPTINNNEKPIESDDDNDSSSIISTTSINTNINIGSHTISTQDNSLLIITGSGGITLVFFILGSILLYIFWKLRKLKQETDSLNDEIKIKKKSIGIDQFGNDVFDNNNNDIMSNEDIIKTPHPPQRHKVSLKQHERIKKKYDEERDYSSELYLNCNIEGNETQTHIPMNYNNNNHYNNIDIDDDNMILNGMYTLNGNGKNGELSMTSLYHKTSNDYLKIKIPIIEQIDDDDDNDDIDDDDDDDSNHNNDAPSNSMSEETSDSSPSFTIKTEAEQKINIDLEMIENIDNTGYMNLVSPTTTTQQMEETPVPSTPQYPMSPHMDPQQILHSLKYREQPGSPPGAQLPKPKTKGQWM